MRDLRLIMNENPSQPASKSATQQEFLRVFLANEREIVRYVAADPDEIMAQAAWRSVSSERGESGI